jgi:hypothetical protein
MFNYITNIWKLLKLQFYNSIYNSKVYKFVNRVEGVTKVIHLMAIEIVFCYYRISNRSVEIMSVPSVDFTDLRF